MFVGEYSPSIDEKGRIALPVKLRKAFGENSIINRLVLTHGFDGCIMGYREVDWKDFVEKKLMILPQSDPKNRMKIRFILGGASECELDRQGRILIPSNLLNWAGIGRNAVVLGLYDKIEIWSGEKYSEYRPGGEAMDDFARELGF